MVLTFHRFHDPSDQEPTAFFEILQPDTVCWDYTIAHKRHNYVMYHAGYDQKKVTLRRLKKWLGASFVISEDAATMMEESTDPLSVGERTKEEDQ